MSPRWVGVRPLLSPTLLPPVPSQSDWGFKSSVGITSPSVSRRFLDGDTHCRGRSWKGRDEGSGTGRLRLWGGGYFDGEIQETRATTVDQGGLCLGLCS